MPADERDPDIPDEYLVEIGRVSTRWSILESIIDLTLMKLAGMSITDSRALIVFNHMAFPMKLDVMGALVSELSTKYPELSQFPRVLQSLRKAQEQRNIVVHSKWGMENGTAMISSLKARGKLTISMKPISIGEIRAIADLITTAICDVYLLTVTNGTAKTPPQSGQ